MREKRLFFTDSSHKCSILFPNFSPKASEESLTKSDSSERRTGFCRQKDPTQKRRIRVGRKEKMFSRRHPVFFEICFRKCIKVKALSPNPDRTDPGKEPTAAKIKFLQNNTKKMDTLVCNNVDSAVILRECALIQHR